MNVKKICNNKLIDAFFFTIFYDSILHGIASSHAMPMPSKFILPALLFQPNLIAKYDSPSIPIRNVA